MPSLDRGGIKLEIFPEKGSYSCESREFPQLRLKEAGLAFLLRAGRPVFADFLALRSIEACSPKITGLPETDGYSLTYYDRLNQLEFQVEFAIPAEMPLLLLRQSITNLGATALWPERLYAAIVDRGALSLGADSMEPSFFSNGWQSWSPSASYRMGDKQDRSWMGPIANPMIYDPATPVTRAVHHFSSDMFACLGDLRSNFGFLAGYLSQKQNFSAIESKLGPQSTLSVWASTDGLRLDPGETFTADWASFSFVELRSAEPFKRYLSAVAAVNEVRQKQAAPLGWCSWYYYFQNLKDQDIYENLAEIDRFKAEIPLKLVQVDDGFEKSVGEWLEFSPGFKDGPAPVARAIKDRGYLAGLWLAPYIVEARSGLVKKHPDWLLRNRWGMLSNSGFGWNRLGYALDLTNPEAMAYSNDVIHTAVRDWGFEYLKLDFLYAAVIAGRYQNPRFTRAQVLRMGLENIRKTAGDSVQLLGCGCPLGPAIGLMDFMRISADVSPEWEPSFLGHRAVFRKERNMPSARNAIRNIIARADLDGHWWGNDPDCLLVRESSKLSLPELQSLATSIGMTAGAVLVSDRMAEVSKPRRQIIQALIPVIPDRSQVPDRFERHEPRMLKQTVKSAGASQTLISLFNWEDRPQTLDIKNEDWGLPADQELVAREFWTGKVYRWKGSFSIPEVPAHGVVMLTPRLLSAGSLYLGSSFHFSQAYELKTWTETETSLNFSLDIGKNAEGTVYLLLNRPIDSIEVDGMPTAWSEGESCTLIHTRIDRQAEFQINFRS